VDRLRAGVPIPAALHTPTNTSRDVSVRLRIGLIEGSGGRAPNGDAQCIRDLNSAQCPRRPLALHLPRPTLDQEMDLKGEHIMASRSSGRNEQRPNTRGANSGAAGSSGSGSSGGRGSTTNSSRRQPPTAQSNAGAPPLGASTPTSRSQTSGSAVDTSTSQTRGDADRQQSAAPSASAPGASATRGDQQREVRTTREQGSARSAASSQRSNLGQRGNIGQESGGYGGVPFVGGGSSPFAIMRRMMDDMDRLFSDFGFTHPGALASSLLQPGMWPRIGGSSSGRSAGQSSSAGLAPAARPQQGLQRAGQGAQSPLGRDLWSPQVEVFERGNNLVIRADLPGLSRDDVDVEIDDDTLIIRGERHSDIEDEQEGFYRSERSYGSFYRAIPLPDNIDVSACNATFKEGVLEITLQKPPQQQSRARRIDVR
jgi:HSP20 family protein